MTAAPEFAKRFISYGAWCQWRDRRDISIGPDAAAAAVAIARRQGAYMAFRDRFVPSRRVQTVDPAQAAAADEDHPSLRVDGLTAPERLILDLMRDELALRDPRVMSYLAAGLRPEVLIELGTHAGPPLVAIAPCARDLGQYDVPLDPDDPALPALRDGLLSAVAMGDLLALVSDLPGFLAEIARVLSPDGVLLAAIPFAFDQPKTEEFAKPATNPPEALAPDPVAPEWRRPIRRAVGWDILEHCRQAGLAQPEMVFVASGMRAMASADLAGVFCLRAYTTPRGASGPPLPPLAGIEAPVQDH